MGIFGPRREVPVAPSRPSTQYETQGERTTQPIPDYAGQTEVETPPSTEYGEEPTPEKAVPVFMVSPPPADETYREWNAATLSVGSVASQIASQDRRRERALIRNHSEADDVVLTRSSTDSAFLGFLLRAGEEVEMLHNGGIWAYAAEGVTDPVPLTVLTEFTLDLYRAD